MYKFWISYSLFEDRFSNFLQKMCYSKSNENLFFIINFQQFFFSFPSNKPTKIEQKE